MNSWEDQAYLRTGKSFPGCRHPPSQAPDLPPSGTCWNTPAGSLTLHVCRTHPLSPHVSEQAAITTLAGSCRSRPGARGLLPPPPASARGTLTAPVGRPRGACTVFRMASRSPSLPAISSRRAGTVSCSFFCFQGQEQCPAHGGPRRMKVYGRSQRRTPGRAAWNRDRRGSRESNNAPSVPTCGAGKLDV